MSGTTTSTAHDHGTGGSQAYRDSPRYAGHPFAVGDVVSIGQGHAPWRVVGVGSGWITVRHMQDGGALYPDRRLTVPSSLKVRRVSGDMDGWIADGSATE